MYFASIELSFFMIVPNNSSQAPITTMHDGINVLCIISYCFGTHSHVLCHILLWHMVIIWGFLLPYPLIHCVINNLFWHSHSSFIALTHSFIGYHLILLHTISIIGHCLWLWHTHINCCHCLFLWHTHSLISHHLLFWHRNIIYYFDTPFHALVFIGWKPFIHCHHLLLWHPFCHCCHHCFDIPTHSFFHNNSFKHSSFPIHNIGNITGDLLEGFISEWT